MPEEIGVLNLIETCELGGAERVMMNLASGLDKRGFHSVVCLRKKGGLHDELVRSRVETYILNEGSMFDFKFLLGLVRLVRSKHLSLIHAHEFLMSVYGTVLGMLTGRPVVTTIHGKFYFYEKARRRAALRLAARLGQLVCVSDDLRAFVCENVGIPLARIRTIYNGVNAQTYGNGKCAPGKAQLGIEEDWKVVGVVANLYAIKGHTYLLQAIPRIIACCRRVVFLFIGLGEEEEKLQSQSRDLRISEHVRFLGFRPDVPELLSILDAFVLPSLSECLPLSVLEAMAASVPLVVTDVGGNREIVEDGQTGFLVPARDCDALAEKLSLILNDGNAARDMASRAHERLMEKFSMEAMLDQYQSLYKSLLDQ